MHLVCVFGGKRESGKRMLRTVMHRQHLWRQPSIKIVEGPAIIRLVWQTAEVFNNITGGRPLARIVAPAGFDNMGSGAVSGGFEPNFKRIKNPY
jgi:hypothetical protein